MSNSAGGAAFPFRGPRSLPNSMPVNISERPGNPIVDATGAARTTTAFTLFDSKFSTQSDNLLWDDVVTGGATDTFDANLSSFSMTCGTASGDRVYRRSKQYVPYQPGKANTAYLTGVLGELKTNVTQRIGLFDDNDGIFFEQDGTDLKVVRRTSTSGSVVDNDTTQSNWNLDPMDGSGQSGITIDTTQMQVFIIDYQWLGAGLIRFGFLLGGILFYCHEISTANLIATPWSVRGNLPVSYEIENTGTAADATEMLHTCSSVQTTGGLESFGQIRSINSGASLAEGKAMSLTTEIPILSIRLDPNNLKAGIEILNMSLFAVSGKATRFLLTLNGTLTGATWTDSPGTSIAEQEVDATEITGGEIIASGYTVQNTFTQLVTGDAQLNILGSAIDGTPDQYTISGQQVDTGNSPDFYATIDYKEFI